MVHWCDRAVMKAAWCQQGSLRFMSLGMLNKFRSYTGSGLALARAMTGLGRAPLFISWNLTFRCNLRCGYCGAVDAPRRECTTEEIVAGLKEMYGAGARWVTFGGGEPLLRPDLGALIADAKALGYQVFVSTNGHFLPGRLDDLRLDEARGLRGLARVPGLRELLRAQGDLFPLRPFSPLFRALS